MVLTCLYLLVCQKAQCADTVIAFGSKGPSLYFKNILKRFKNQKRADICCIRIEKMPPSVGLVGTSKEVIAIFLTATSLVYRTLVSLASFARQGLPSVITGFSILVYAAGFMYQVLE